MQNTFNECFYGKFVFPIIVSVGGEITTIWIPAVCHLWEIQPTVKATVNYDVYLNTLLIISLWQLDKLHIILQWTQLHTSLTFINTKNTFIRETIFNNWIYFIYFICKCLFVFWLVWIDFSFLFLLHVMSEAAGLVLFVRMDYYKKNVKL